MAWRPEGRDVWADDVCTRKKAEWKHVPAESEHESPSRRSRGRKFLGVDDGTLQEGGTGERTG